MKPCIARAEQYYIYCSNVCVCVCVCDAKKSLMSHTALVHPKQYLHNKKRRPNKEHKCGASQIPSECQVKTSSQL